MRSYRLLLRLYPASFRNEYAEEMAHVFSKRRREAAGPLPWSSFWIATLAEVIFNAALVHWDIARQDMGYAARVLRRAPGFALTAVLLVALGIGATTAAFSLTDFVLLRPLPFPRPDRLVKIWERTPGYSRMELSPANYRDWNQASTSFERIGAYYTLPVNIVGRGEPMRVDRAAVSPDLFAALGVQPLLGRAFRTDDDRVGAPKTVILSHRFWQTEFGGGRDVIGRQLMLDSSAHTIIGVMPADFRFPSNDEAIWTPLALPKAAYQDPSDNFLEVVGRLRDATTIDQARVEWTVLAARSRQHYPKENENTDVALFPLSQDISQTSRLLLLALAGAALCVLLIACANLANLLLARALARRRELAVRTAIGAGRERLVRQLITESLLLALVGGGVGVALATASVPLLARLVPRTLPIAQSPAVDLRVLVFAALLTAFTGIAFGLAPVMRLGRDADLRGLREGSRAGAGRKERLRAALVVAQIVASIVLMVSAGLLVRALWSIQAVDPGFKAAGVLTLRTELAMPQYAALSTREVFYNRVLSDVRALPGVSQAAYVSFLPMVMGGGIFPVSVDGRPAITRADTQVASLRYVTPGYFAAMGIPLVSGRDVADADTRERPFVAVVSESFVRQYWPNQDPIGRHFQFAFDDRTVIGVARNISVRGLERSSEPQVYLPYRQVADGALRFYSPKDLVIRTTRSAPATLVPSVRAIVRKADARQPVSDVQTLAQILERQTAPRSVQLRVIAGFAVIAFLLAAIGIHGLLSFSVSQRAQEIGIRMALGAQANDILNIVVRRGVLLAVAGTIPGIALAYAAGLAMQGFLFGVTPADGTTYLAVAGMVVVMTIAGTLLPTRRALRVDPITALRTDE